MKRLYYFLTVSMLTAPVFGQNTWSVSVQGGPTQFYGDLRQYTFYPVGITNHDSANERGTFFGGLTINKQVSHRFGVQLGGSYGLLRGMKRQPYNSYFRATYATTDLTGSVNLNSLFGGNNSLRRWKTDVYAGVGMIFFRSTAFELGTGRVQRFTKTNLGDGTVRPADFEQNWTIPMGITVQYELSPRVDLGLDVRFTYVNSEHLDATVGGVSNSAFDLVGSRGRFDGAEVNLSDSGNDKFGYAALSLTYKLGRKVTRMRETKNQYGANNRTERYHVRWADVKPVEKPPVLVAETPPPVRKVAKSDSVAKSAKPVPARQTPPQPNRDTDSDGIPDYLDKQPKTPVGSVVSGSGESIDFEQYVANALPEMTCAEIFANIQFDTDKAVVRPQYHETLRRVIALMNKTRCRLQLSGHTDQRASETYNMALSRRRVEAVREFLIRAGLADTKRLVTNYFGALKPIDDGSEMGLTRNRRVELKLMP
jgi:OmpA-OmpF porin, OOP family